MDIELVEKELLSIMVLRPKIGLDLLQIKSQYLSNKNRSLLFDAILNSYEKHGVVDTSAVVSYKPGLADVLVEAVSNEYVPILDVRKQFMICQKTILDNHKKCVIRDLTNKLNAGSITCDAYLEKMAKVSTVEIKDETNILTAQEITDNINNEKIGIKLSKFPKLSEALKLVQGDFLIIGANTGVGKSALLLNLMNNLMNDYQCIYFNMEMSKSTIYKRILSIKSGIPLNNINNPASSHQRDLLNVTLDNISKMKIIVEHKATYLQEIKQIIARHKDDNKHTIIFLDHIGLIKCDKKNIYEQTTEVAKSLRQFCLDYDCTIIAACQLNRASYNSKELNASMLKDSGELENSSSKVILLYKNKNEKSKDKFVENMILDIVKNRDGRIGKIAYTYDKSKQIFEEVVSYE